VVKLSTCASPSVACPGSRCNGLSTSAGRRTLCLPRTLGQPCAEASLSNRHYVLIPFSGSPGQIRSPHHQDTASQG